MKSYEFEGDGDRIVNGGCFVLGRRNTPIVIVTQRGAVKRMLAQEISQTSRAKRGVTVMRELKKTRTVLSICRKEDQKK